MTFNIDYKTETGLENLFRRLKPGQILKGKIIDCLELNGYLLRIRGYNILTQSNGRFQKFEDIFVKVKEVDSHLVLDLIPKKVSKGETNRSIPDIVV